MSVLHAARCRLRKAKVLATVEEWITEARSWNSSHAAQLSTLRDQLVQCMNELK
jgi:hypothetical protein